MILELSYDTPKVENWICLGTVVQIGETSIDRKKIKVFAPNVHSIKTFACMRNLINRVKSDCADHFSGPIRFNETRLLERHRISIKK